MANTEVGSAYLTIIPSMKGFGSKVSSGVASELSSIGGALAKSFAVATAASAAAVASIGKQALDAYGEYEQLVGGMDTLFKSSSGKMQKYAAEAYKTSQMSANEYMKLSTDFAASLISSLGGDTEKAADYANKAMGDMADNANKMGTSMEDIENAYKGFSKQNYTMLDNLKLGYGGTKSEMERLIEDANKVKSANGEMADLSIDSFADVVEAVHTIQEEMGITGTTALEASTTIQGSVSMAQASWENWLTGLGSDSADMTTLTQQLVESVATAAGNIVPRLAVIMATLIASLPSTLQQFGDTIGAKLPEMWQQIQTTVSTILPAGVQTIFTQLGELLANGVSALGQALVTFGPGFLECVMQLFSQFMLGLATVVTQLTDYLPQFVTSIGRVLSSNAPDLLDAAWTLFTAILEALVETAPSVLTAALELLNSLVDYVTNNAPKMLESALDLIGQFLVAIAQNLPTILVNLGLLLGKLVSAVVNAAPTLLATLVTYFGKFLVALVKNIPSLLSRLGSLLGELVGKVASGAGNMLSQAGKYFGNLLQGAKNAIPNLLSYVAKIPSNIVRSIGDLGRTLVNAGSSLITGLFNGIKNSITSVYNYVSGIANKIAALKGPISYDRKVLIPNGKALMESLETGIRDSVGNVYSMVSGIAGEISSRLVSETQMALDASGIISSPALTKTEQLNQAITATNDGEDYTSRLEAIEGLLNRLLEKDTDVYMDTTKVSSALARRSSLALRGAGA